MKRKNCWEVKKCGRQPGGNKVDESGVCPAASSSEYNGMNNGTFRGRFCWTVEGTLCDICKQKTLAEKLMDCINCDHFREVNNDEGRNFVMSPFY